VGEEADAVEVGLADCVHHAVLEAAGRSRCLGQPDLAASFVEVDEVGKRPADVYRGPRRHH
jgi:hypothetical protein